LIGTLIFSILELNTSRAECAYRTKLLVVRIMRQFPIGKLKNVSPSGMFFSIQSASREAVFSVLRTKKGQMGFDRCAVWGAENRPDVSSYLAQPGLARHIRTGILLPRLLTHKVE